MSSRNKKNIFKSKKNKRSSLPSKAGKKTIRPKSVKSKKPTKEVVPEAKVEKKKSFVRREADKTPEVLDSAVHVAPPAEVNLEQPVEDNLSHEEIVPPIASGIETSSQETGQEIQVEETEHLIQNDGVADSTEVSSPSGNTAKTTTDSENVSSEKDQSTVVSQAVDNTVKKPVPTPAIKKEVHTNIIRKKETTVIPPKRSNKLGKAVISVDSRFNKRKEKTPAVEEQVIANVPSEKEDRRKKGKDKEKVDRFDRGEKLEKKPAKKRARTKLRTPKMEIRIDDFTYQTRRPKRKRGGKKKSSPKPRAEKRRVFMSENITVGDLAHQLSVKSGEVIKKLLTFDMMCTQNDTIDYDTAQLVAEHFEYEVVNKVTTEEDFLIEEKEEGGETRPAVVTIMGHVDHGKTTLLDTIRKANVAKGEAGGITQHISAYQASKNGQLITFIDTPGHKAFTAMRSRGAKVTDIVILVVAADDGVMPQTEEALSHAQAAGVEIIVAVNKCDKPNANPERVKQELMARDLVPEEYGGDCMFVEVSALKGDGIDDLLENILLIAEMNELTAPTDTHAEGTVLEARLDKGRGPVATVIVKKGTLKRGDSLVLGTVCGRVRAMSDHSRKKLKEALPSTPVEIIGLESVPNAGDDFTVVKNDKDARALVSLRIDKKRQSEASKPQKLTLEQLLLHQEQGEILTLNLILKTDVGGTLEAIKGTLDKIDIEGTEIKILHSSVGAVTEGDITLAHTYGGIVIGFNVRPDSQARKAINRYNVDIKTYKLIHELENSIRKALKGMLSPETEEKVQALVEVREIYHIKAGTIAGCVVMEGKLHRKNPIRLIRNGIVVWEGKISSLRRHKDDVREVEKNFDCGIMLEGFGDIKPFDQLESYALEEVDQD